MGTSKLRARLEAFVEFVTPYAYRVDALGDLIEECGDSFLLYIKEVVRAEPVWYGGQVRRSFDPKLTVGQAVFILLSFAGIGISIGSIMASMAGLATLLLCDARSYPDKQSAHASVMASAIAGLAMLLSQAFFNLIAPSLALQPPEIGRAAPISVFLVAAFRVWYRRNERAVMPASAVGAEGLLPEARRQHRNIWRMNLLFLFAWVTLGAANPSTRHDGLVGFLPVPLAFFARDFRSGRSRLDPKKDSPKSLFDYANPKKELSALGYQLFSGSHSRPANVCEFLMFAVISAPLFTAAATWPRIVTNFTAIGALAVIWVFVRRANQATAAALKKQIDTLPKGNL